MATLAPSLANLRSEINARWPNRDKRSDGWIGDADHKTRVSDHNPDSRGIVHAIDIDKDGIDPTFVISRCLRDNWPTKYVIYNRRIWQFTNGDWRSTPYNGKNPHTDHIHVSIKSGTTWEASKWHWGIATVDPEPAPTMPPGPVGEMNDWNALFSQSGLDLDSLSSSLLTSSLLMRSLIT